MQLHIVRTFWCRHGDSTTSECSARPCIQKFGIRLKYHKILNKVDSSTVKGFARKDLASSLSEFLLKTCRCNGICADRLKFPQRHAGQRASSSHVCQLIRWQTDPHHEILVVNKCETSKTDIDDSFDEIQALFLVHVIAIVHRSLLNLIRVNIHAWSQTPTAKCYFYHQFSRQMLEVNKSYKFELNRDSTCRSWKRF